MQPIRAFSLECWAMLVPQALRYPWAVLQCQGRRQVVRTQDALLKFFSDFPECELSEARVELYATEPDAAAAIRILQLVDNAGPA